MELLLTVLGSGAFRRFLAMGVNVVCIALNKKFGLDISEQGQLAITGTVAAYVAQGAWKEAAITKATAAGDAAAASVTDIKSAIEGLKK
jgi:hypothetical protein